jgi:ribonucleoside-diphosphate reductase alpha chain
MCKIGEIVVVGGVRRSAMISLSNLSDDRMRVAKSGQWWIEYSHRSLANNSVAYTEKPEIGIFMKEWLSLYESKSGERGIFNRMAAQRKAKKLGIRKWENIDFLTNPCAEISLRSMQFCNLSEVVVRDGDTLATLKKKLEVATIIGTMQSTLVNFRYLRSAWKKNCEEERLLGVSLTGIMDHEVLSGQLGAEKLQSWLAEMRNTVHETNKKWASMLGINESTALTTVKPSGTVSQLVDSSSGIHPRYAKYYIRTVRNDRKDPLSDFLVSQGVPHELDVMNPQNWVFSFPIKSPDHCVTTDDINALGQLEIYKIYNEYWADHNISITIYVNEPEWMTVGAWVYDNFDILNGVSFLPHSTHIYQQAPYQPISEEKYLELRNKMPTIDWSLFNINEHEDNTIGAQQLACSSGVCELI